MSVAESFIDTNVFIYQLEALDEAKFKVADAIIRRGVATGDACISFQVVQETLNVVLRKAEIPLDAASARRYLERCWRRSIASRRVSRSTRRAWSSRAATSWPSTTL